MKIKYIKENFFDDDNVDALSAEEVVVQDHADTLFKNFNDILIRIVTRSVDSLYKNYAEPTNFSIRMGGVDLYFPVLHDPNSIYKPNKIRIITLHLARFIIPRDVVLNNHKDTPDERLETTNVHYDVKTKNLTLNLNWKSDTGKLDMACVRIGAPSLYSYSWTAFTETQCALILFFRYVQRTLKELYDIAVNDIVLNISVNSVPLITITRESDFTGPLKDYWNYIHDITGKTSQDFLKANIKYNDSPLKRDDSTHLKEILPEEIKNVSKFKRSYDYKVLDPNTLASINI